ncbi:MAG: septum site-determining protein MinC [Selenomonadaceae bacterium]|nr:septum site-determining protein MinC [Selenomonadaceae bacterium]
MQDELVKIKGVKQGLLLIFNDITDFNKVEEELNRKLTSGFFMRGTHIFVKPGDLSHANEELLRKIFARYGLIVKIMPEVIEKTGSEIKADNIAPTEYEDNTEQQEISAQEETIKESDDISQMLVVNRTLRGGQEIKTKSSVLVCGNVNPGAQIIAGGSIDIRGKCSGMVHAGAYGNTEACIIADRLHPTQIRIANLVARPPDDGEETERAERASIKDGQIVIEPIER